MRAILVAVLLAPLCGPITAQTPPALPASEPAVGPIVLQLNASTRALSMGGAYMITSPDADVIFYNPQLLSVARGQSMSMQRYGDAATLITFAAAMDANFGFGVQVLDYALPRFNIAESVGSRAALSRGDGSSASEALATVGYARTIKGIRLGLAAKWAQHWGGGYSEGVGAIDVGSSLSPLAWLMVALSVQNIGGNLTLGEFEYELPMVGTLLVTQRPRVTGPLDVSFSGRLSAGPDVDPVGGVGADVSYWPFTGLTFAARGGVRFGTEHFRTDPMAVIEEGRFTAGGGVTWSRVTLDYAWEPFYGAADAHRVGLRIR